MLLPRHLSGPGGLRQPIIFLLRRRARPLSTQGTVESAGAVDEAAASRMARRGKRAQEAQQKEAHPGPEAAGAKAGSQSGSSVGRIVGMATAGTMAYALYRAGEEGSDLRVWFDARSAGKEGPAFSDSLDLFLRSSVVAPAYVFLYDNLAKPFIQPSREKLLPDWHSIPNIPPDAPCPPTLILDLEDTLVHATWDPKFGWRYVKRPGVDKFLQDLSKYYEIVLFSPSNFSVVDPVIYSLDKTGTILHRLYKDSTRFYRGKHVKDLAALNRDLRQVVIVDDDPDAFQFQPDNGIRIKPFVDIKDKSERSLDKLRKFLLALVMEGIQDFPGVLRQFKGMDADQIADVYERRLLEAKMRQAEESRKGLGGLLRSTDPFKGAANPFGAGPPKSSGPRLSAKDIVGGVAAFDEKAEAPATLSGPTKKGKYWEAYQSYMKEAEEDQRRKMELWQKQQAKREEERRRKAMEAAAAGR